MSRYAPADAPNPFTDGLPTLAVPSARVHLRHPTDGDLDAIAALFSDDAHLRYWSYCAPTMRAGLNVGCDDLAEEVGAGGIGRGRFG